MKVAYLEHINVTVGNADKTARLLCKIFDWNIRWSGPSIHNGYSVHVGNKSHYLALYSKAQNRAHIRKNYTAPNGLNHVGIVVDDLDEAERRVMKAGYTPTSHQDYEPGHRFYFMGDDDIEYEVVCYARNKRSFWRDLWCRIGETAQYAAQMK